MNTISQKEKDEFIANLKQQLTETKTSCMAVQEDLVLHGFLKYQFFFCTDISTCMMDFAKAFSDDMISYTTNTNNTNHTLRMKGRMEFLSSLESFAANNRKLQPINDWWVKHDTNINYHKKETKEISSLDVDLAIKNNFGQDNRVAEPSLVRKRVKNCGDSTKQQEDRVAAKPSNVSIVHVSPPPESMIITAKPSNVSMKYVFVFLY